MYNLCKINSDSFGSSDICSNLRYSIWIFLDCHCPIFNVIENFFLIRLLNKLVTLKIKTKLIRIRNKQTFHFVIFFFAETICPEGWNLFRDFCIRIPDLQLTYDDAKVSGCTEGIFLEDTTFGFWSQVFFSNFFSLYNTIVKIDSSIWSSCLCHVCKTDYLIWARKLDRCCVKVTPIQDLA